MSFENQESFDSTFQRVKEESEERRARNDAVNYKGQVNLAIGDKWQPLPSITYGDKLKALFAVDYNSRESIDINKNFDIKYCQETGLYYIKRNKILL